jgi:hypothetical protein
VTGNNGSKSAAFDLARRAEAALSKLIDEASRDGREDVAIAGIYLCRARAAIRNEIARMRAAK